jgi:glycosyltransferase involved in cell wall biosynthesis
MNDLISVIIPAYNAEKYLDDCLKSITSQTHQNIEVIVVNDGSIDATGEIADKWSKKDNRIWVIHQTNQGVSSARNVGLDKAKGDFIGFVDADDEVELDMYEFLYCNLREFDADISHCGFELVKLSSVVKFHDTKVLVIQDRVDALKELLSGYRVEPSIWNKLYKKSVLRTVRFNTDIAINEDLVFNVAAFDNAHRSVFEDVIKYKYKHNPLSASRSSEAIFIGGEIYKAVQEVRLLLSEEEIKSAVEKFYIAKLLAILKSLKKHNLYKSALAKKIRGDINSHSKRNLGLRILVLRVLLIKLPILYSSVFYVYNLFVIKKQKWNENM